MWNVRDLVGGTEETNSVLEKGSDSRYPVDTSSSISEVTYEITEVLFTIDDNGMSDDVETLPSLRQNNRLS